MYLSDNCIPEFHLWIAPILKMWQSSYYFYLTHPERKLDSSIYHNNLGKIRNLLKDTLKSHHGSPLLKQRALRMCHPPWRWLNDVPRQLVHSPTHIHTVTHTCSTLLRKGESLHLHCIYFDIHQSVLVCCSRKAWRWQLFQATSLLCVKQK